MEVITTSTQETEQLAIQLAKKLLPPRVIALYGDLGAGKTTFTRFLVTALGSDARVQSPTFVLARHYKTNMNIRINHLDLYRLKSKNELKDIDFDEFFEDETSFTIIEWPEVAETLLPKNTLKIKFEVVDDTTRKIYVENID